MSPDFLLTAAVFVAVMAFVLMIGLLVAQALQPAKSSTHGSDDWADTEHDAARRRSLMGRMGALLRPAEATGAQKLNSKLLQAGLYKKHAAGIYLALKLLLMISPMLVGVVLSLSGVLPMLHGVLWGALVGLIGNFTPSLWLGMKKSERQKQIRRSLPDALDVIVICMEGGLSLPASLDRVASELRFAHPLLAGELAIARREIQLGRSTGEALRQLAERFDVDELRSLGSVVTQSERYGASLVRALQVHADSLRLKRYQYAEAMAQKAPVKLVFPTVLCIFPALYVVLMGPAGLQFLEMLENL